MQTALILITVQMRLGRRLCVLGFVHSSVGVVMLDFLLVFGILILECAGVRGIVYEYLGNVSHILRTF